MFFKLDSRQFGTLTIIKNHQIFILGNCLIQNALNYSLSTSYKME